jgi:S1-C subfamily serine protease
VNAVDLIIVGFTLAMAVWGFSQGMIVGGLSLCGFVGGAILGSRLGPLVLDQGAESPYAPLVTLVAALALGGLLATGGEALGFTLRRRMGNRLGALDGVGGAVLLGCVGLGLAWIAGAVALHTPGAREARRDIQDSAILAALNGTLPPSGPILNALARFDPFPEVDGPEPDLRAPPRGIARDAEVRAAASSVVKVLGTACGLGVQGSGWIAGDGLVVTNAHVVAGQDDTTVQVGSEGPRHDAEAVFFDAREDLAVLRSAGVQAAPALDLDAAAEPGTPAAILGFPMDGAYEAVPGRLGETVTARTQDAYGRGPVRRELTLVRGEVRSGNSGGPMVDGEGEVVTTIFAATAGDGADAGYGVPAPTVASALEEADGGSVGTGPCTR